MKTTRRTLLKAGIGTIFLPAGYHTCSALALPQTSNTFVDGPPPPPSPGSWSIAVLPDTQNYSEKFPEQYLAQTKWIVDEREHGNIQFVLHLGDVTNHQTAPEWENAVEAMQELDGQLPYFLMPGNHDYEGDGRSRTTRFSEYFPPSMFSSHDSFGGVYDKEPDRFENSFHLVNAGGRELLILCLEFRPRHDVVRWANEMVSGHQTRQTILVTHAYMYCDDTRYDWAKLGRQ